MPNIEIQNQRTVNFIVLIVGVLSIIVGTILSPPKIDQYFSLIFLAVFVFVLELLPLKLFHKNYTLTHIMLFSAGLLFGIGVAVWGCLIGIVMALGAQYILGKYPITLVQNTRTTYSDSIFDFGSNSFNLVLTFILFGLTLGASSVSYAAPQAWLQILGAGIFFGIVHGGLFVLFSRRMNTIQYQWEKWDLLALSSIEIMLIFLGFVSLLFFPLVGELTLVILGVIIFALSLLLYYLSVPRKNLERRLQELSTLEEISRILSTEIELEKLLSSIQMQVTNLLEVDNFYVALLDPVDRQIWYPLAVKHGVRKNWQRRPLTQRLTDKVILDGKPVLIPRDARRQLSKIGLPSGEDAPYAWIGVPLITSEQTIGCLALFSMDPEIEFNQDDLNLLSILSGQTSVAIEIALHNALLSSDLTIGHDRLTTILNSVNEGLLLFDSEGRISIVNESVSDLTGIPQSEFINYKLPGIPHQILEVLGFPSNEGNEVLGKLLHEQVPHSEKFTYKIKNRGSEIFLERSFIHVRNNSDNVIGLIVTIRDITDEYLLKQTQALISETLVHDLRSPLGSTISALDVIQDAYLQGDPAGILEPSIQIAKRSSKRMLAMVESIMEINRMEAGMIELKISKFDLKQLIIDSISEFQIVANDYRVSLNCEFEDLIPQVIMDQGKIQRVIHNLIDNALKYSPEGEQIIIKIELSDQETIKIHVLDRGPGIPEEYVQSIFDRFFQVPESASRKRGTGLGLTYCRLVVEAHNGSIWMVNRPSGGSDFVVSLPIAFDNNS